jgi:hypothetical protein
MRRAVAHSTDWEGYNLIDDIDETQLVTNPPAPHEGGRVHYRTFADQMADWFEDRFL